MKRWAWSLFNAALSGAVTGTIGAGVFHGTWKQDLVAFGIAAGVSGAKWYLQHPPPGVDGEAGAAK